MHITLVDDSIPFDGYTAAARPLGGAEKAFAALAGALARRGHEVLVFNRCRWSMYIDGAHWETLEDGRKPLHTDVLVAFRKAPLLEFVRQAKRRVLWWTAPPRFLDKKPARPLLDDHKPLVILSSDAQAAGWQAAGLQVGIMPPALRDDFLEEGMGGGHASTPRAMVTTHPAHGLDWLVDLWVERIHPKVPHAELVIRSVGLANAVEGQGIPPELEAIAAKVLAAKDKGVMVVRPQGDLLMAQAYREARVHLYPGHEDDMTAFTLMESQACGTPAVLRPLGAAPGRVANGSSAYVVPDDEAFANLTALLLSDDGVRANMGREARALYAGRNWDKAAEHFEALLG